MSLTLVTAPLVEPITIEDARAHLRLDASGSPAQHPDDLLVESLISVAREYVENFTGRCLCATTYALRVPSLTGTIELPKPPATDILSVEYFEDGLLVPVDPSVYELGKSISWKSYLKLAYDQEWPSSAEAIITYVAGYNLEGESPAENQLPKSLKAAMLLLIGHLYENREATAPITITQIPLGIESLIRPYRISFGMA